MGLSVDREGVTVEPYYRRDLALVHHKGFGFHADDCGAPASCGCSNRCGNARGSWWSLAAEAACSPRHLLDAGHRVIATDASPSMLDLAHGVEATVQASFGDETFPIGLHAIFGRKSGSE